MNEFTPYTDLFNNMKRGNESLCGRLYNHLPSNLSVELSPQGLWINIIGFNSKKFNKMRIICRLIDGKKAVIETVLFNNNEIITKPYIFYNLVTLLKKIKKLYYI